MKNFFMRLATFLFGFIFSSNMGLQAAAALDGAEEGPNWRIWLEQIIEENPNKPDVFGNTPLHYAAQHNCFEWVQRLIEENGVACDVLNHEGKTPLDLAQGLRVKQYLVNNYVLLAEAKEGNLLDFGKALHSFPIYRGVKDRDGRTILHLAAIYGHIAIVQFLIVKAHFDINAQDSYGCTPLHLALTNGQTHIVRALIAMDTIDLEVKNVLGLTSVHMAAGFSDAVIMQELLNRGIELDLKINLQQAYGFSAVAQELRNRNIEFGLKINLQDAYGRTPLHWAVMHGDDMIVKILLAAGAKTDIKDGQNRIPLDYVSLQTQRKMANMLLVLKE